jgi:hypothetical protein
VAVDGDGPLPTRLPSISGFVPVCCRRRALVHAVGGSSNVRTAVIVVCCSGRPDARTRQSRRRRRDVALRTAGRPVATEHTARHPQHLAPLILYGTRLTSWASTTVPTGSRRQVSRPCSTRSSKCGYRSGLRPDGAERDEQPVAAQRTRPLRTSGDSSSVTCRASMRRLRTGRS